MSQPPPNNNSCVLECLFYEADFCSQVLLIPMAAVAAAPMAVIG